MLAILLRTGRKGESALDLARRLLSRFGSLHSVAAQSVDSLVGEGIGAVRAATLVAAFELGRRVGATDRMTRPVLASPEDVVAAVGSRLRDLQHEEFWVLLLNSSNRLEAEVRVTSGTLNASLAHPRECFSHAVLRKAASVIFVHNHPSGNPTPSAEDISLTRQLAEAGRILGIPVHDHVIIAGKTFMSFAEQRLL